MLTFDNKRQAYLKWIMLLAFFGKCSNHISSFLLFNVLSNYCFAPIKFFVHKISIAENVAQVGNNISCNISIIFYVAIPSNEVGKQFPII